jgi:hypothetical protein
MTSKQHTTAMKSSAKIKTMFSWLKKKEEEE